MNTIQERLGVAVESDAIRFSGKEFAEGRGEAIARSIKRRRAVRAAGYGGGTALALGGLVLGATRLPALAEGGWLTPGAVDCVTPEAEPAPPVANAELWPDTYEVNLIPGESAGFQLYATDAEGESSVRYTLEYDPEGRGYATIRNAAGESIGEGELGFLDELYVEDEDRVLRVQHGPERDVVTVQIVGSESESVVVGTVPASPSATCQPTPTETVAEPSPEPSPEPTPSTAPVDLEAALANSPFTIGALISVEEQGNDMVFFTGYEWVSVEEINGRIAAFFDDDTLTQAPQAAGPGPVLTVEFTEYVSVLVNGGGQATRIDPAVQLRDGMVAPGWQSQYFVLGYTFVAVRDGVVVGAARVDSEDNPYPAVSNQPFSGEINRELVTLLNPEGAFLDANGEVLEGDFDIYAVAGYGLLEDGPGFVDLRYSWAKVGRP